ncbi:hypothetical protein Btru_068154 [Bulinus truncatus]|nr:hypothetical protein Btru_068154 [Bulinus truncatus]
MPSRKVCFVCGSLGGEYQLHSKPHEGQAYFPFLEHHEPPKGSRVPGPDGIVDSCRVCCAFLTQQWETYERTNTPALKRLYWLKRLDDGQFTGAEMKLQGEYMAQVMGLQYQPSCGDSCAPLSPDSRDEFSAGHRETDYTQGRKLDCNDGALDLSVPVKTVSKVKINKPCHKTEVSTSRASPDQLHFVCFICGTENQGATAKLISSIYHVANKPFFPFLTKLTPPKGATPLNEGVCSVCDHCFSSLCHQWVTYEQQGTPSGARIFKVNGVFFSNDSSIVASKDIKSSLKDVCYLCSQTWPSSKMCPLYTAPLSGRKDHMYFPFIRELRRPHGAHPLNPDGSVQVCFSCYGNLQIQWRHYESERVPFLHRRYSLLPPSTSATVSGLYLAMDAEGKLKNHGMEDVLKDSAVSATRDRSPGLLKVSTVNNNTSHEVYKPYNSEAKLGASNSGLSIPHPLQQAGERPKKVCFVCGEKCLMTKAQLLHTYPGRQDIKSFGGLIHPFFPFLGKYEPPPGSDPPNEEGIVISCSYCYYSLLNQWKDYEEFKMPGDLDRFKRKYKLHEFVCYVCGMMVPRKKLRTLEVQKFLFLREHKAPSNALVMWGGQAVGACSSCHFSLTHQYTEFERLGLPLELRKYNWTVQHHQEENKDSHHNDQGRDTASAASEENYLKEGIASYPSFSTSGKLTLNSSSSIGARLPVTAIAPPSTFNSPNNSSAPCLSSFSAALRKLAYQTKDSPDDSPVKHSMSPSSHNSSRSTTPKRAHPLALSSKSNSYTGLGQSHNILEHHRQPMDRASTSNSTSALDYGNKTGIDQHYGRLNSLDTTQGRDSKDDVRSSRRDSRDSSRVTGRESRDSRDPDVTATQTLMPNNEFYNRDFPSYLTEEEAARLGLTIPLRIDPTAYMAAYHPFYLQQQSMFPHSSFRLDDQLLLEQYRMLQSSFLPFPGAGYFPGHPGPIDVHSMLAAAAAQQYPLELLQQHYSFMNSSHPLLNPRFAAPGALVDRNCLDEEKLRLLAERSKEHERLLDWEVKHEPTFCPDREYKKPKDSDSSLLDKSIMDKHDYLPHHVGTSSINVVGDSSLIKDGFTSVSNKDIDSSAHSSDLKSVSKLDKSLLHNHTELSSVNHSQSVPLTHEEYLKLHLRKEIDDRNLDTEPYSSSKLAKLTSSIQALEGAQILHKDNPKSLPLFHQHHPLLNMTLPTNTSSSLNHVKKPRCSSDSKTLFRPFDDSKPTSDSNSGSCRVQDQEEVRQHSSYICSLGIPSLGLSSKNSTTSESHPAILSIPLVKPFLKSVLPVASNTSLSEINEKINPSTFANSLTSNNKLDPLSYYVRDKVERFDFKSLARECSSSSMNQDPVKNCLCEDTLFNAGTQSEILSKLDVELGKRKTIHSQDDIDSAERKLVRLTMVERATPIHLETPESKMELLEYLGVTTWAKKKELLLEKEVRRRQQLGLSSISPIQCEAESTPEFFSKSKWASKSSQSNKFLKSKMHSQPECFSEKSKFLCDLGLVPQSENDKSGPSQHQPYSWPGVGSVIDSYYKFNEEQLKEAQLLHVRCQQLQADNDLLIQASETYNRHMTVNKVHIIKISIHDLRRFQ